MTKKQRQEAVAFMYENKVEFVCAPYGVYHYSVCDLCYFNNCKDCPDLEDGTLLCRSMAHSDYKTFFRKIHES